MSANAGNKKWGGLDSLSQIAYKILTKTHYLSIFRIMDRRYREFYEELSRSYYEEKNVYASPSGKLRLHFIRRWVSNLGRGRILDAGCGSGINLTHYKGEIVGVDIGFENLIRAKRRLPNGMFIKGDIENLNFLKPASFDYVLMNEIIEHIPSPALALSGIYEALKPSGKLLITAPNWHRKRPIKEKPGILDAHNINYPEPDGYLHTAYKPEELKHLAESVGFKVVEYGTIEKEIRYWPTIVGLPFRIMEKIAGKRMLIYRAERATLNVVLVILKTLGIAHLMRLIIKDGRRSYIVAEK